MAKHVLRSLKLHDFDLKEVDASRAWSSLGPPELRKSKCRKLLTRKNHTLEAATRLLRVAMKLVVKRPDRFPPEGGIWVEGQGGTHEGQRGVDP